MQRINDGITLPTFSKLKRCILRAARTFASAVFHSIDVHRPALCPSGAGVIHLPHRRNHSAPVQETYLVNVEDCPKLAVLRRTSAVALLTCWSIFGPVETLRAVGRQIMVQGTVELWQSIEFELLEDLVAAKASAAKP